MNLLRTILILLFLLTIPVHSGMRYVSKTGSSISPYSSWATASKSIAKAIVACNPNDTILVANGVYKETFVVDRELTMIGESMDSTVIDARGLKGILNPQSLIDVRKSLHIKNFHLLGSTLNYPRMFSAILCDLFISDCRIEGADIGILLSHANIEADDLILRCPYRAIDVASSTEFTKISNCIMTGGESGILVDYSPDLSITNCIIYKGNVPGYYHRIDTYNISKVLIANNVIEQDAESGLATVIGSIITQDTVRVLNNVFMSTGRMGGLSIYDTARTIVRNNILMHNQKTALGFKQSYPYDYNLFYDNGKNFLPGGKLGTHDIVADPMIMRDSSGAAGSDFHLQKYSPAIDSGDPEILDRDGSRSDIGLYGGPYGESYSYSDLAPRIPRGLTMKGIDSITVELKWRRNTERDTSKYLVYSSIVPGVKDDSLYYLTETKDTLLRYTFSKGRKIYFRIKAVDLEGNRSALSEEIGMDITSVDNPVTTPEEYTLYPNYPNPFNPSTTIGYRLKESGKVRLTVYDIKGEIVRTLQNSEQAKGYHEIRFNAEGLSSGIYLCRIEVTGKGGIPQYSDMKKMTLVK